MIRAGGQFPQGAFFPSIVLKEPPKDEVLADQAGAPFRGEAFAIFYDRATNKTFEAVTELRIAKLSS